ncbi:hypothetical protein [Chitinimonas sp. BJYL2]|nr:hypothetical protein [Chitinimonas sp. BJYL2]
MDAPDSLKKTVANWGLALRESRHGREHAHRYLQQVNDLLGWHH